MWFVSCWVLLVCVMDGVLFDRFMMPVILSDLGCAFLEWSYYCFVVLVLVCLCPACILLQVLMLHVT